MNIYDSSWDAFNHSISLSLGVEYAYIETPNNIKSGNNNRPVPWNKGKKGVQVSTRKGVKQKPLSDDHKEKIRQAMLKAINPMTNPINREKISNKLKGRVFSPEHKEKLRLARRNRKRK